MRIAEFIQRRQSLKWETRRLREISRCGVKIDSLKQLTPADLSNIFTNHDVTAAWNRVAPTLADVCQIEDLKTGGVNPGDRRALWYLVRMLRPTSILEIGTHVGASTFYLAAALRSLVEEDGSTKARLVTVDIDDVNERTNGEWRKRQLRCSPSDLMASIGCSALVRFVTRPSLSYLADGDEPFDLIFLDGDHAATTVYQEVCHASTRLTDAGVLLLHDYFPRNLPIWRGDSPLGPFIAMSRLVKENRSLKVLPLGELPWLTKLGTRWTTLAVVTRLAGERT